MKCAKCGEERSEDKREFCWQCGYRNSNAFTTREEAVEATRRGIPKFASIEDLTFEAPKEKASFAERLGDGIVEIVITVIISAIAVPFLRFVFGGYGLYASIGFILLASGFVFWRVFHRDPLDSKGLDLDS